MKNTETIFEYSCSTVRFKLNAKSNGYECIQSNTQNNGLSVEKLPQEGTTHYESLKVFWLKFTEERDWFVKYKIINCHETLLPYIIRAHNNVLTEYDLKYNEHKELYVWIRKCFYIKAIPLIKLVQYCSKCRKRIGYDPRYPKKICYDCFDCDIVDENGESVSFYNIDCSGGLKICWRENGILIKEDKSHITKRCFINEVTYTASEHRFGGIVIQKEV